MARSTATRPTQPWTVIHRSTFASPRAAVRRQACGVPPISVTQDPVKLSRVGSRHDDVVSRAQLVLCGFDADAVRRRLATGRWQALGLAVVLHGGPVTPRQRQWAAILAAPGPVALGGRTAAIAYGLRGFETDMIDVIVPASTKPVAIPGVRWRRSRRFQRGDVTRVRGIPVVTAPRAVIDAAAWTPAPRVACALVAAAVQQRVVRVANLRRALVQAGKVRHCDTLAAILADIEGGADSLAEIDFSRLARKAGLPPPIRQSIRLDSAGRRRYLDADFGTFAVEVDGGLHLRAQNYWDDARRQNELVLGGDRILRFPSIAIRLEEDVVIAQLRAAGRIFGVAVSAQTR
jgi:hypothetical protein